ncbi:MAG: phosphoribosylformylglycinamidine synthase [Phycisphaerales bacterium]|nr:phosphoribosylformylglycinamidine synthase [Phycisphaerales bacterium]
MTVHRFEVRPVDDASDPRARAICHDARRLGFNLARARTARVYLIEAGLSPAERDRLAQRLLADPVTEQASLGASAPRGTIVEVLPLPGVMDPAAQSVRDAVRALTGHEAKVTTGWRYDLEGLPPGEAEALASRLLANTVVHAVHLQPFHPASLPAGSPAAFQVRHVTLRSLDDAALERLSRDAHLFLSLDEMRAIRDEYRRLDREPTDIELETLAQTWSEHCVHKTLKSTIRYSGAPEPSGPAGTPRPGHSPNPDGSITIDNLLKSTVAAATHELIADGVDWTLSVFKDNSGVIAFDDAWGLCIKVETHNHPSALEPYGGAATGAGGCIRDVIGTGLGAKPIANTSVFCVAHPGDWSEAAPGSGAPAPSGARGREPASAAPLPPGCIHPRRVLQEVVAGVRDYGNQMGIPTVSGAVAFDDRYVGNPLVFCGCIGLIPRHLVKGRAQPGDRIIALGGRTGRDGIHGATFSSAELTDSHADEFAHAVQIGNAITEKRLLDAILRARDVGPLPSAAHPSPSSGYPHAPCGGARASESRPAHSPARAADPPTRPLFSAITDCGAGGFSSAVGEMGAELGAHVHLDRAPLKYDGLTYTEIWISEAQERMVIAVPPENVPALHRICDEEGVELADLGAFGTPGAELILSFRGHEVARLPMAFLHEGIPTPTREAFWKNPAYPHTLRGGSSVPAASMPLPSPGPASHVARLTSLLSHPNIASKHWIVRQYDHEVQGNTILKPLVGPLGRGPGDASILEPVPGSRRAAAIGQGLCPSYSDPAVGGDPYLMALAAIDECVRNLVCVGADPERIAILDNFCWPSCTKPENLASLVRACWGCYDGAKAYRTPFVSGKDSLNNQFTVPAQGERPARTIEIPSTLLITGLGLLPDGGVACSMDLKRPDSHLVLLHTGATPSFGGSTYQSLFPTDAAALPPNRRVVPRVDLARGPRAAKAVHTLISAGLVRAAHDVSEGGLLVALAEMLIAGSLPQRPLGCRVCFPPCFDNPSDWFGELPSAYLLEVSGADWNSGTVRRAISQFEGVHVEPLGTTDSTGRLDLGPGEAPCDVEALARAWRSPLDW